MPPPCPDEDTIAAFVDRQLDEPRRAAIERHCHECSVCRQTISHLVRALAPPPAPEPPPATRPDESRQPGSTVGRYLLLHSLGAGAVGVVYAAYDPQLDRRLAIKLLQPRKQATNAAGWRARMVREAQALATISHPNVVSVHDAGTHDDEVFIAMELVDGVTISQWLLDERPTPREVLGAFVAAGRGLAAAHHHELVHRDFKPDNIMIDRGGRVRVTDFGLARLVGGESPGSSAEALTDAESPRTQTGALVGTPAYMAPEVLRGDRADARSDQFAFCVALYEALYGTRPFEGGDTTALRAEIEAGTPRRGPTAPRLRRAVRHAIRRGLSADPQDRFADMDALLRQLQPPGVKRWLAPALLVSGLVAGGSMARGWAQPVEAEPRCPDMATTLDDLWNDERKDALGRRLGESGREHAERTWMLVTDVFDRHADRWAELRQQLCEAPTPAAATHERVSCLRRNRREFGALVDRLEAGDPSVVDEAATMALRLRGPDTCLDGRPRGDWTALLPPGTARDEAEAILDDLVEPRAMLEARQLEQAEPGARRALERAQALGHGPAIVEAMVLVAEVIHHRGRSQEALALHRDAALLAVASGYRHGAVRAWTQVAKLHELIDRQADRAGLAVALAQAELDALGSDEALQAQLEIIRGDVEFRDGDDETAEAAYRRARELFELHSDVLGQADVMFKLTRIAHRRWQFPEAHALLDEVETIYVDVLGPTHPLVGVVLATRGATLNLEGVYPEARVVLQRALDLQGPQSPDAASTHDHLGSVLMSLGEYRAATEHHGQAIELMASARGADNPRLAFSLSYRAHAWLEAGDFERARADIERAVEVAASGGPSARVQPLKLRAELAIREGRHDDAIADWEESIALERAWVGEGHTYTLTSRVYLGTLLIEFGRSTRARSVLEAVLVDSGDKLPQGWLAEAHFALAKTLDDLGVEAPRAQGLAQRAREEFAESGHLDGVEIVDQWLAEHPAEP